MVKTTPEFWDCECETNYIKQACESICNKCNTHREVGPDSHIEEVLAFYLNKERSSDE